MPCRTEDFGAQETFCGLSGKALHSEQQKRSRDSPCPYPRVTRRNHRAGLSGEPYQHQMLPRADDFREPEGDRAVSPPRAAAVPAPHGGCRGGRFRSRCPMSLCRNPDGSRHRMAGDAAPPHSAPLPACGCCSETRGRRKPPRRFRAAPARSICSARGEPAKGASSSTAGITR